MIKISGLILEVPPTQLPHSHQNTPPPASKQWGFPGSEALFFSGEGWTRCLGVSSFWDHHATITELGLLSSSRWRPVSGDDLWRNIHITQKSLKAESSGYQKERSTERQYWNNRCRCICFLDQLYPRAQWRNLSPKNSKEQESKICGRIS